MTAELRLAAYTDFLRAVDRWREYLVDLDPSRESALALAEDCASTVRDALVTIELVAPAALVSTARDLAAALSELGNAARRRGWRRRDFDHAQRMRAEVVALFRRDLGTRDALVEP
jgi:anti-sigma-K factor RskA